MYGLPQVHMYILSITGKTTGVAAKLARRDVSAKSRAGLACDLCCTYVLYYYTSMCMFGATLDRGLCHLLCDGDGPCAR
jgi:hypothetical protein